MDSKDKISQILKEIKETEINVGKNRYNAIPMMFIFIALLIGFFFNLSSNIIHNILKKYEGNLYEIVVVIFTIISIIWFLYYLKKNYLNPIKKSEKKVNLLIKKLKDELIK
jgi:CRISPR/Cas system CSM-associated protein Csm4 (group 5 of RAMP superfamily)